MPLNQLINPAGGLRYHALALRWGWLGWRPFRRELAGVLETWNPPERRLLIIGPSGGYNLSAAFLRRFEEIVLVEPDPLARLIFRLRFRGPHYVNEPREVLADEKGLAELIRAWPRTAFLFSNVLGQRQLIHPRLSEEQHQAWLQGFERRLRGRSWFSFHDKLSAHHAALETRPLDAERELPLDETLAHFFGREREIDWHDHGTTPLFPELPRRCLLWMLDPWRHHVIECLGQNSSS